MPELTEHLHHLADTIGPRPATTDAEARAADYIEGVMRGRGLEVERQEFDAARSSSWTFVLLNLLTIVGAVLTFWLPWVGLALALIAAVVLWLELDTRPVLSGLLPKGPSQNVIARHVPRQRRGEPLKRVILVAHYDSAKSSLAFGPRVSKSYPATVDFTRWATVVTPLVILFGAMPFAADWKPWTNYAALAAAGGLIVPLLVNVHRELFMHATDGANDNASGVAALLSIMERVVPEPEPSRFASETPVRRSAEEAIEADVVLEDALLTYTPVAPVAEEMPRHSLGTFDDLGWDDGTSPRSSRVAEPESAGQRSFESDGSWGEDLLDDEPSPGQTSFAEPEDAPREKKSRSEERHGVGDWLGLGKGFDVRREGRKIGTWDNFVEDEDDDFGLKGGSAGETGFEDPAFASEEAARIRRRVTTSVDRALVEKEVWFVATGAKESGSWGMRAFLKEFEDDARDALIINLDSIGAGTLHWVTKEGISRRYHSDRRLASSAKRVAREEQLLVKLREYRGATTDATSALARGYKALTFMGFDINGRVPNWHEYSDTVDSVSEENMELATEFVTKLIREL